MSHQSQEIIIKRTKSEDKSDLEEMKLELEIEILKKQNSNIIRYAPIFASVAAVLFSLIIGATQIVTTYISNQSVARREESALGLRIAEYFVKTLPNPSNINNEAEVEFLIRSARYLFPRSTAEIFLRSISCYAAALQSLQNAAAQQLTALGFRAGCDAPMPASRGQPDIFPRFALIASARAQPAPPQRVEIVYESLAQQAFAAGLGSAIQSPARRIEWRRMGRGDERGPGCFRGLVILFHDEGSRPTAEALRDAVAAALRRPNLAPPQTACSHTVDLYPNATPTQVAQGELRIWIPDDPQRSVAPIVAAACADPPTVAAPARPLRPRIILLEPRPLECPAQSAVRDCSAPGTDRALCVSQHDRDACMARVALREALRRGLMDMNFEVSVVRRPPGEPSRFSEVRTIYRHPAQQFAAAEISAVVQRVWTAAGRGPSACFDPQRGMSAANREVEIHLP